MHELKKKIQEQQAPTKKERKSPKTNKQNKTTETTTTTTTKKGEKIAQRLRGVVHAE